MPVTASLSRRFYERFGDDITNELVDWLNSVDATYQASLRDMNEANFARSDAKMEQRFAAFGSRMDALEAKVEGRLDAFGVRMDAFEGRFEQRFAAFEAKAERRFAAFEAKTEQRFAAFEAKTGQRFAAFEAKTEQRFAAFEAKTEQHFAAMEARMDGSEARNDQRIAALATKEQLAALEKTVGRVEVRVTRWLMATVLTTVGLCLSVLGLGVAVLQLR
jgi:hypothetical protein